MKKRYQKLVIFMAMLGMPILCSGAQRTFAAERTRGWSNGVNLGVARLFDDDLGLGLSARAFLEYAPYIHEIALRLSGGYFRFQDEITLGQGVFTSEEDVIFENFYLTGGVIYRFSRRNVAPFISGNIGVYHYRKEDVSSASGPIIDGVRVSPYDTVEFRDGYDFGLNLGGGLEFFTSERTSISMELLLHALIGEVDDQIADFTVMFRFLPQN